MTDLLSETSGVVQAYKICVYETVSTLLQDGIYICEISPICGTRLQMCVCEAPITCAADCRLCVGQTPLTCATSLETVWAPFPFCNQPFRVRQIDKAICI